MNGLENALLSIVNIFNQLRIPYMIIGGLANVVWGESRSTLDIDITIWAKEKEIESIVKRISKEFKLVPKQPLEFIRETRVLPLDSKAGVRIDLIFGVSPFEETAIKRAVQIPVAGMPVNFCTPEDLILSKMISDREKDLNDAREIILRQHGKLDLAYLEPCLKELAQGLRKPAIWDRWQTWKEAAA